MLSFRFFSFVSKTARSTRRSLSATQPRRPARTRIAPRSGVRIVCGGLGGSDRIKIQIKNPTQVTAKSTGTASASGFEIDSPFGRPGRA